MDPKELEKFLQVMRQLRIVNATTREKARHFLRTEGVLTEDNQLAEPYSDRPNDTPPLKEPSLI